MKNPTSSRNNKGFSLVELLVVITIIAILAGASYPAITAVMRNAKISEGEKMANDLVFAIEQFEQKYDYLPYPSSRIGLSDSSDDDDGAYTTGGGEPGDLGIYTTRNGNLLKVLMGMDEDINPKNTRFFEFKTARNGVNGIIYEDDGETPKAFVDPWGNPFTVVIDYTGDRKINFRDISIFAAYREKGEAQPIIRSQAAIAASPGPDQEYNDKHDVKSW